MAILDNVFGKVFTGRRGPRGSRRVPSRKPDRRLTVEHVEPRVMMSASPICNVANPNIGHLMAPALLAEANHCNEAGLASVSSPTISVLDAPPVQVGTAATQAVFTVNLSAASTGTVTMFYGTGDGTATAASGAYTPTCGTLTFSPGQTSETISVPVAGMNTAGLPNQTFFIAVGNPAGGTIARQVAMATIVDAVVPASLPTISVLDAPPVQVGTAATQAIFTVNLSAASTSTVTMFYGTGDGTATAASGAYTPSCGTLTFSPGQTSETISVPVAGMNTVGLPNQTFFIAVGDPAGGTITRQLAMATIVDVVSPAAVVPTISVLNAPSVQVGTTATQAVFTVNLSAASTSTVTVFYGTGDGIATAASGAYTPTCGTLTFSPGQTSQTISVPVAGTTAPGASFQTIYIAVGNPANATIARQEAMAIIVYEPAAAAAYAPVSGTLFGPNGPSYLDVQQGQLGDCWLMASLAEVADRDPADISNMFTAGGTAVENGSTVSLYNVRFYNNAGVPEYFTVDTELPSAGGILRSPGQRRPVGGAGREGLRRGQRGRHGHQQDRGQRLLRRPERGQCGLGIAGHHRKAGQRLQHQPHQHRRRLERGRIHHAPHKHAEQFLYRGHPLVRRSQL